MHRTHLPLTVWFWTIYLCATDKRGISAVQLSRTLGICYESAWYLLHRIRRAMAKRDEKYALSGIVEMDDGYVGGATRNGKRGRGTDKARIVVALSKTENGAALFARMHVVEDVTGGTLQQLSLIHILLGLAARRRIPRIPQTAGEHPCGGLLGTCAAKI